jgi:hypothetical protein
VQNLFLDEKQNEPYRRYGEVSIAAQKQILRQERLNKPSFAWFGKAWCVVQG